MAHINASRSRGWTLSSDAKLLSFLKDFSTSVLSRAKAVNGAVKGLQFEVSATEVRLGNTLNRFEMLSHTQFIENRVYEDDDAAAPAESGDAAADAVDGEEQNVAEAAQGRYKCALELGLGALTSYCGPLENEGEWGDGDDPYNMRLCPM